MSSSSFSTTCALPWALCCKRESERERERETERERERGGGRSSYNCLFSRFSMELDVLLTLKGEESLLRLFLSVKVSSGFFHL